MLLALSTLRIQSCQIPKLSVNNAEISSYFVKAKPLDCSGEPLWLEVDQADKLVLTEYAKKKFVFLHDY